MNFMKHIGRHGDQKVIILYRKVPNEDHMCLVVYPDRLPRTYHDPVMKVLESKPAQDSNDFSEVMFRNLLPDGRPMLNTLHAENHIRKVQNSQIIVTPNNKASLRLDQLNEMVDKINAGGEAAKKLADLDQGRGLTKQPTKKEVAKRKQQAQEKQNHTDISNEWTGVLNAGETGVLSNADIANDLRRQSATLAAQAKGLVAEAERLLVEAANLAPEPKVAKKATKPVAKKKPGRKAANL